MHFPARRTSCKLFGPAQFRLWSDTSGGGWDRVSLYDFAGEVLVACPACRGSAMVKGGNFRNMRAFDIEGVRVVCPACGYSKALEKTPRRSPHLIFGAPVDPFSHLPLWLQLECCGGLLWAYNAAHLDCLCRHVASS